MENLRSLDIVYDSDEPLIRTAPKRPVEIDAESQERHAKKPKTKTEMDEHLASHFEWADAIHNTAKYGVQVLVDELQERIEQLEQELAISKEEAGLAYNANVALGALTIKHTELKKTKDVLQQELNSVKGALVVNAEAEGKLKDLQEELRHAKSKLQLKEIADEKLKETHMQQFKAREDQIRLEFAENVKNEAWKLKAEWEAWCKAPRLSLDKNTRVVTQGDVKFTDIEMRTAVEIIRCSDPKNPTLFDNFIWTTRSDLEYEAYPTNPLPDTKSKDIILVHESIQKKLPVKLRDACLATRQHLWAQRRQVLACVRSHPYYGRCGRQAKLQIAQECIDFFDRRFTFQVVKLINKRQWSPKKGIQTMFLGGTEDTARLSGVEVGAYKMHKLNEMDEQFWRALKN